MHNQIDLPVCLSAFLSICLFVCLSVYLSYLHSASPQTLHHIRSALHYSHVQGLSMFHPFIIRIHLLPGELPVEHTGGATSSHLPVT